ncbi:60S ribosomal protein L35-2 [Abeliophyllum distichum]|uniref:60S ribosomal protein L35-2 n=1 Tax=Abeliophyllum distichum TaxID=126358 RepID=A0ABD1UNT0_9LAMI
MLKINVVRLSIAQVLTVISKKQKAALREAYKNKKYLPLDLRPKKTRAIYRHFTKHQASLHTEREKKKEKYFPMRKVGVEIEFVVTFNHRRGVKFAFVLGPVLPQRL